MKRFVLRSLSAVAVGSLFVTSVAAAVFPDVPAGHLYQEPIERLVAAGVIAGNPDGKFYPDRSVNRAEMLKMLYLAAGITPDASSSNCFSDVQTGSWYEPYVCDASSRHFVDGYLDGTFRPGSTVNRVESLKMIQTVFGLEVADVTSQEKEAVKFVDVSTSAWYTKYLYNAYRVGILPIAGQSSSLFQPDADLQRGEAAAMIYNALNVEIKESREKTDQQLQQSSSSSAQSVTGAGSSSSQSSALTNILEVKFPLSAGGKFDDKQPFSYRFKIDATTVVSTDVALNSNQPGTVGCTLFLLKDNGFSDKYYIGTEEGKHCYLLTTLTPGNYQLQLQPSNSDTTYTVSSQIGTGDGNDGFSEAVSLTAILRTHSLVENNLKNWYTFSVTESNGKRMKVELTNSTNVSCIVYSMSDVDLYGFQGPECNQFYTYPPGTYYVAVGRTTPRSSKQTYTIRLSE